MKDKKDTIQEIAYNTKLLNDNAIILLNIIISEEIARRFIK
jgi:hypothetical protein